MDNPKYVVKAQIIISDDGAVIIELDPLAPYHAIRDMCDAIDPVRTFMYHGNMAKCLVVKEGAEKCNKNSE